MHRLISIVLLMAALCAVLPAGAQQAAAQEVLVASGQENDAADRERQATRQRLAELKAQIAEDQQHLSETTQAEQASLKTLEQLDRQIALRKELVRNYGRRMQQISGEMGALRTTLSSLGNELETLRTQYRSRAAHAYKHGRMHDLALIASSKSINQMLVRVRYLHRFAQQRRGRLAEIHATQKETEERNEELKDILDDNERLLDEERSEQQNLERLHQSRTRVISDLRATRSTIEQSLETKRAAARDLENRIRELIAATDRDRLRAREDLATAQEYAALSGSFLENRGQLPWPVKGVMREPFGDTVNPVYGTKTRNPGIIIEAPSSAEVRAVFDGRIIDISVLPEYGRYVVIEHGVYKSVYSNFSDTFIAEGDLVRIGQAIGRAGTPDEPKGTALFFALFKEGSPIDPSPWLVVR